MTARLALTGLAAMSVAACATTAPTAPEGPVRVGADGTCDAEAAQALLGETATQDVGARLLELTGARKLRWVPPRTAVTMDFRPDRLTVTYHDDLTIERISCG